MRMLILRAAVLMGVLAAGLLAQQQLNNEAIIKLHNAGLGDDMIVNMVNTQPGQYALGVDDVVALKQAGVSEKVIAAMMGKNSAPAASAPAAAPPAATLTIADGTPVKLRLTQTIFSDNAREGQEVPYEVSEAVLVDGVVVLPAKAKAVGVVTKATAKGRLGKSGKLDISVKYAVLADQERLFLTSVEKARGGHGSAKSLLIPWAGPAVFLMRKGTNSSIPEGTEITAYVRGEMRLDPAKLSAVSPAPSAPASSSPAASAATPAQVSLTVASTPAGADIEIDGGFVGNTPSTITVGSGGHDVVVRKKGFAAWTKKINVADGRVSLTADLQPAAVQ
ncbi:MAG: PEGA domain-containing protein [Bryobacteraceae bacterium]